MFLFQATETNEKDAENLNEPSTQEMLREWAVKFKVPHNSLNSLLRILQSKYDASLPSDARTLLKTPINLSSSIKEIAGGQYYHFGLLRALDNYISKYDNAESLKLFTDTGVSMKINCDGIPLHKSSKDQFWPILVQFCGEGHADQNPPQTVGLFYGTSKPNNVTEYLDNFLLELETVLADGYRYNYKDHLIPVKLSCFICDAPARQFLKVVTSHNGYHGCERCQQNGIYVSGTVVFPELNHLPRTDDDFLNQSDEDHHKGTSPLVRIRNIGLVSQFTLDPMHLVFLGVVRKLLNLWLKGPLHVRIGSQKKQAVSDNLLSIAKFMPSEFNRKPRSLDDLDRFKATEFRSFLLYTGPIALLDIIDINVYRNFLLLSAAINLLSRSDIDGSVECARRYLHAFIEHFCQVYGRRHVVYNVHNLSHLPDDVEKYGTIDKFCAFSFENYLGYLKKLLRKPNQPLMQVVNRITENNITVPGKPAYPILKRSHTNGPLINIDVSVCQQYKEIYLENYCFKITEADHGVMIGMEIGCIRNIVSSRQCISVIYQAYAVRENFFDYPLPSGSLGIFKVSRLQNNLKMCSIESITAKYLLIPFSAKTIAFPLLHSDWSQ